MPCNWNHRKLAEKVMQGFRARAPIEVNIIAITDGITMGTEGMKASLSAGKSWPTWGARGARGHMFDGLVTISGCDKTIPAMVMCSDDSISWPMLYCGSIMFGAARPGPFSNRNLTIQDVFEALGAYNAGKISAEELKDVEDHACPGEGACGGQFTANTMTTAYEMLGMSPMGWNGIPAPDPRKEEVAFECGKRVMELVRKGITPRSLITRKSFENAIAGVLATAAPPTPSSTRRPRRRNSAWLSIDDFDRISRKTRGRRPEAVGTLHGPRDARGGRHGRGGQAARGGRPDPHGEKTVTGRTIGGDQAPARRRASR